MSQSLRQLKASGAIKAVVGGLVLKVTTAEELGDALNDADDTIEIEGDLRNQVIRIRARGRVVWAVAFVGLVATVGGVAVAMAAVPVPGVIAAGGSLAITVACLAG